MASLSSCSCLEKARERCLTGRGTGVTQGIAKDLEISLKWVGPGEKSSLEEETNYDLCTPTVAIDSSAIAAIGHLSGILKGGWGFVVR